MVLLSHEDTRKLADLRVLLTELDQEILHIKEMLEQLAYDNCSVRIHFAMQNEDAAQAQKQKERFDRLMNGGPAVNNYTGQELGQRNEGHTKSVSVWRETAALRILNVIFEEKNKERTLVLMAIRDIVAATEIPTQTVYSYECV